MPTDQIQLAVQAHLAEFSALRQELLDILKWRDGLIFVSLGTTGALFSFAFSTDSHSGCPVPSRQAALYLVAPLATIIGGLWLGNAWRTYRIGKYIRDVLSPKLNTLIGPPERFRTDEIAPPRIIKSVPSSRGCFVCPASPSRIPPHPSRHTALRCIAVSDSEPHLAR
jgi:hypothetical protein